MGRAPASPSFRDRGWTVFTVGFGAMRGEARRMATRPSRVWARARDIRHDKMGHSPASRLHTPFDPCPRRRSRVQPGGRPAWCLPNLPAGVPRRRTRCFALFIGRDRPRRSMLPYSHLGRGGAAIWTLERSRPSFGIGRAPAFRWRHSASAPPAGKPTLAI